MNKKLTIPPSNKDFLSTPAQLATRLETLIGQEFPLTRKSRTDGSRVRKLIAVTLLKYPLPEPASSHNYEIMPPKKKGVPKILREFIDTYIVTTGDTYNLQVWNRNPTSSSVQVRYSDGSVLSAKDVRFVFVPIDPVAEVINSIVILTPEYIQAKFGAFGKPTIKHQLIIPNRVRDLILTRTPPCLLGSDTNALKAILADRYEKPNSSIHDTPESGRIYALSLIAERFARQLIGMVIPSDTTKNRGQTLEKIVAEILGYTLGDELLSGNYPDIRNQLLEVKIQDSATVDLGLYSPQFEEAVPAFPTVTTQDIRYLIALMDSTADKIAGLIICSGDELGKHFTYVADESFKSQRSIPMSFFRAYKGRSVFNP